MLATNVGSPVTSQKFEAAVAGAIRAMEEKRDFSVEEHIELVRIWNTLQANKISESSDSFRKFVELYRGDFQPKSVEKLEATLTKGMAWYSKRHDVYIGGSPHANSQFLLPAEYVDRLTRKK